MEGIESITTYLYIAFGVLALLGFLVGLFKGLFRTLLDLAFTALNLLISSLTATAITTNISTPETINEALTALTQNVSLDASMQEYVTEMQTILNNPEANTKAVSLIIALVAVIVLPLVFMVLFFALGLILKIPKLLIEFLVIPKAKSWGLRFAGGAIGVVCNILSLAIFLIPIVGYVTYANDTLELMKSEEVATVETVETLNATEENESTEGGLELDGLIDDALEFTRPFANDFAFKTIQNLGGRALFKSLTTIDVEGTTVSLTNETQCVVKIYKETGHFNIPFEEYGKEQVDAIERIEKVINEAEFMPSLVANALSFVAKEWEAERDVFGLTKPYIGTELQEALDHVIHALATTTEETFKEDISTVATIGKECISDGVISVAIEGDPEKMLTVLEESDIVADVLVAFHKNDRLKPAIPGLTNGLVNYVYKIYDEVNGTTTPPHEIADINSLDEEAVKKEGQLITQVVVKLDKFLASIEGVDMASEDGMYEILNKGDFATLGQSFNHLKESYLLGDMFEFLLSAALKSEACSTLGIIDDMFIENATKEDADLEKMLVARQQLAKLIMALKDNDETKYNSAIESLIHAISSGESESLKTILTYNNLRSLGFSKDRAQTVSGLLTSMVNSLDGKEFTPEDAVKESKSTGKIVNAVNSAIENKDKSGNVFNSDGETDDGLSNITADEFVETAIESELVSSMISDAIKDENGDVVDDPYKIHDNMSDSDLSAIENALANEYNKEGTKDDPEKMAKLENIAHILGIDTSELFK